MPVAMLSTSLFSEPKRYGRFNALDTENPFGPKPGMVLIKPTSIANSGGSASIGTNGQVTFASVTSLSLNGVFSADFDNYVLSIRFDNSTGANLFYRLRASGTDNSTASSYVQQYLQADTGTVSGARSTSDKATLGPAYATQRAGLWATFYGPFLAQPTAVRSITVNDYLSAAIQDNGSTHNQSTSYDGVTLYPFSGNTTGALQIYGVRL